MQGKIVSFKGLKRRKSAKYVLSYGGGVNSTALLILLARQRHPLDYVVFADTGSERPETYDYLKQAKQYCDTHRIPFQIVGVRNGDSLYDRCERRRVVPSKMWRWCTRDFKVKPIYSFYRSLKSHVFQYVGIDYDEVHRIKDSKEDYVTNIYPLVDLKIGRDQCVDIIRSAGLPVPMKSGCYFCPFRNNEDWANLYQSHPKLYRAAMDLEENNKHMPKQALHPLTLRKLAKVLRDHNPLPIIQNESPCGSECMT